MRGKRLAFVAASIVLAAFVATILAREAETASDASQAVSRLAVAWTSSHFLVTTQTGTVGLLKADRSGFREIATVSLFDDVADTERDTWSHPALVGNRLYVRNLLAVYCFLLE